ncbi:MAG: hypothetical protein LBQ51_08080 [Desulfovibrio sp.]|jgi:hypothetical protein|nr:hypothetical protein [Desulfovibrio sp.]
MHLSMPEAQKKNSRGTRRLRLILLAALCAVAVGAALRHFSDAGLKFDAARPSGVGAADGAPPAGAEQGGSSGALPPAEARGPETSAPDSASGTVPDGAARETESAGERERAYRLAEEEAERRLQEASLQEAGAAVAYRQAAVRAGRGKTGAAELAEAEAALEKARAVTRTARRDFEAAGLKRAEAGAEARRASGVSGAGGGRTMPRQAVAGQ